MFVLFSNGIDRILIVPYFLLRRNISPRFWQVGRRRSPWRAARPWPGFIQRGECGFARWTFIWVIWMDFYLKPDMMSFIKHCNQSITWRVVFFAWILPAQVFSRLSDWFFKFARKGSENFVFSAAKSLLSTISPHFKSSCPDFFNKNTYFFLHTPACVASVAPTET